MKRKQLALGAMVVGLLVGLLFFTLVPMVSINMHPRTPDQLAFLQIPTTESLSCAIFGIGAANWPVFTNQTTYEGVHTWHYQLGCPPLATNS